MWKKVKLHFFQVWSDATSIHGQKENALCKMFVYQVATLYLAFIMAITLNAAVCKLSSNVGHRGYDIEFYYTT